MTAEKIHHLVTTDYSVSWGERWTSFQEACAEAARECGQSGMLRSSGYMEKLTKSGHEALSGAFDDLLRIVTRAIEAIGLPDSDGSALELQEFFNTQLSRSASQVDSKLADAAANVGYSPEWSVSAKLESLKQRAVVEVDLLVASSLQDRDESASIVTPWYQRPIGVVVLTVVSGLIIAGIVAFVGVVL